MLVCLLYTGGHGHCSLQFGAEKRLLASLTFDCSASNQTSVEFTG